MWYSMPNRCVVLDAKQMCEGFHWDLAQLFEVVSVSPYGTVVALG